MHSAIYRGHVRHRRHQPAQHEFRYPVFMMYLDLDEIDAVFSLTSLWSQRRFRPVRFDRRDYFGNPDQSLKQSVIDCIHEQTGARFNGSVRLLANVRMFGHTMNPICCFYCFDGEEKLRFIVADVHNTPWGERRQYALVCDPQQSTQRIQFDKQMHVSPFNPMDMHYDFRASNPLDKLALHINVVRDDECHVDTTLALRREPISVQSLRRVLLRFPVMSTRVLAAIYWQALKLYVKKVPFFSHPDTKAKDLASQLNENTSVIERT